MPSFFIRTRTGQQQPLNLNTLEQSLNQAATESGETDAVLVRTLAERIAEKVLTRLETQTELASTEIQSIVVSSLREQAHSKMAEAYERHHAAAARPAQEVPPVPITPHQNDPMTKQMPSNAPHTVVGEVHAPRRRRLSEERRAITHKFRVGDQEGYITVGLYDDGQPGEIFLRMSKEGSMLSGLMDCFATSISIGLQYGVPLRVMARKFGNVQFPPNGDTDNPNIPSARSIIDYVFRWLSLKFLTPEERQAIDTGSELPPITYPTASVEEHIVRLSL
ncbi:hypothetical protein KBB27_03355 [Patescibacteria group bacterium]|nr:hypothetical protein [Patescibacteria group bacterium]